MSRRMVVLLCASTALLLLAVAFDASPLLRGPAPYPPEWQWELDPKAVRAARLAPALLCGVGLLGLLWAGGSGGSRSRRAGLLLAAVLLGWGLQLTLLGLEREGARAELTRRTESGSFTSYYTVATRGPGRDAADYLARHHQLLPGLRKGTPHAATHPPGPVLFYRGLALAYERSAFLRDRVTVPLLGAALLGLLGAAAAFPVAALGTWLSGDAAAGLRLGILWPFVPGVVLMVPQFDQALALLVTGALAALAAGLRREARAAVGWPACAAAGALAGAAFFISYGALSLIGVGALAVLGAVTRDRPLTRQVRGLAAFAGAAVAVALLPALWEYAPWRSLPVALAIHREQFTAPRSYLAWLVFNPWDLVVFLGLPVALVGLARLGEDAGLRTADVRFALGASLGLALLLLSGTLRGESGRILVPLMPVLLAAALARPGRPTRPEALLLGTLLLCIDFVLRLSWRLP
jgi:hypothetical protein